MYSCNITLKNNPAWVQLKCVDAITILKYLSTKMTYINNKNNRKLTPSEKAHVSYYTCIYMFEFFFSLIDFKHHNAKSKSQARGNWVDTMALSDMPWAFSVGVKSSVTYSSCSDIRSQHLSSLFYSIKTTVSWISWPELIPKKLYMNNIFAILLMQPNYLLVSYMVMYAVDFFFIRQSAHNVDHKNM